MSAKVIQVPDILSHPLYQLLNVDYTDNSSHPYVRSTISLLDVLTPRISTKETTFPPGESSTKIAPYLRRFQQLLQVGHLSRSRANDARVRVRRRHQGQSCQAHTGKALS